MGELTVAECVEYYARLLAVWCMAHPEVPVVESRISPEIVEVQVSVATEHEAAVTMAALPVPWTVVARDESGYLYGTSAGEIGFTIHVLHSVRV